MADTGTQKGKRMWPSLHTADLLFAVSNVALIIGLTLTVVATVGAVWMANVREGYLKRELSHAHERIAQASTEIAELGVATAEANAAAEKARENAAMAQERAALLEKEAAQARAREALLRRQLLEVQRQGRKAPF